jgi:hypothetical protein
VLLLDERIKPDGAHVRTWASWDGRALHISEDAGPQGALPVLAVDRVMCRYGRPLEQGITPDGESLSCGDFRLRRLRFHARVDAEARDYLVWERPGGEVVACIATMATAALRYLALRFAAEVSQESET